MRRGREPKAFNSSSGEPRSAKQCDLDPALALLRRWQEAQVTVLPGQPFVSGAFYDAVDALAEQFAVMDELLFTPALTLAGVVAKLEIVVAALAHDPHEFPKAHLRSVLDELRRLSG